MRGLFEPPGTPNPCEHARWSPWREVPALIGASFRQRRSCLDCGWREDQPIVLVVIEEVRP